MTYFSAPQTRPRALGTLPPVTAAPLSAHTPSVPGHVSLSPASFIQNKPTPRRHSHGVSARSAPPRFADWLARPHPHGGWDFSSLTCHKLLSTSSPETNGVTSASPLWHHANNSIPSESLSLSRSLCMYRSSVRLTAFHLFFKRWPLRRSR